MNFECQKYEELAGPDEVFDQIDVSNSGQVASDWLIQLKYDGIWARVEIENGHYHVYSKTGQLKKAARLPQGQLFVHPTILIGEFMFGSQWSTHPDRAGRLYIFDCLVNSGTDISQLPYKDRYRAAVSQVVQLGQPFNILPCYSISKLGEFWTTLEGKTEGFIIRRWSDLWSDTLFKLKFEVEDDFVIIGFTEGKGKHEGRLGALKVAQFDGTDLVYVMDVGGGFDDSTRHFFWTHQEELLNRVVLVNGKGRFAEGALRHPSFVRLRDDKTWEQCTLKRQSK